MPRLYFDQNSPLGTLGRSRRCHHLACGRFGSGWWCPRRPASCAAMPALPSPRDLRRHLLLIHSVEMHLISIKVSIEMYFILIEILKNALFLQPLYFESNFEKWLELRRLPPNSAPDSGVIFHAAAGVGPPRTDIRKSEEKLHLKDSHQTRTGAARSAAPRRYALLSLQTRLLAVFYALGTG